MGCSGCKGAKVPMVSESSELPLLVQVKNYIIKSIIFLVMVMISPIIMIGLWVILFKSIVLSKHIDIIPALRHIIVKLGENKTNDSDDDDDLEEDLELLDVEEINENK